MKILVKEPNKQFEVKEIDGSLKSMQDIVGGYIEVVATPFNGIVLVCNEEGLLMDLECNYAFGQTYVGTIFICRADESELVSLTDEDIKIMTR